MTTKTITGHYPTGFTLKSGYNGLTITDTASVGGTGVFVTSDAYVTNNGNVSATNGAGIYLNAGGTVRNNVGGSIYGSSFGVRADAIANIENYASIDSYSEGVWLPLGGRVTNSGVIHGNTYGVDTDTDLGTTTVINTGSIIGTYFVGVAVDHGGAVTNGSLTDTTALIKGGDEAVGMSAGTTANFGTLNGAGFGVYLVNATLINGAPGDHSALISGGEGGVECGQSVYSNATVTNYGTIRGGTPALYPDNYSGVHLIAGDITNGTATDKTALIEGYNGVSGAFVNTVANFGTLDGTGVTLGAYGAVFSGGGQLTNGSAADKSALIEGFVGVGIKAFAATVANFGTILGTGGAGGYGAMFNAGGQLTNGSAADKSALIEGRVGVELLAVSGSVKNFGTILGGSGAGDYGVYLAAGGGLTNGSTTDVGALIEGAGGVDLRDGSATNFGVIKATDAFYGYGALLGADAKFTNGAVGDTTATVEGHDGVFVSGSASTLTNFGTIWSASGETAVQLEDASDTLVVEAGSTFIGAVLGGGGTLDLASGVGTLTGLMTGGGVTVSGSMATTTFSRFGTLEVAAGATFTANGSSAIAAGLSVIDRGALTIAGGLDSAGLVEAAGTGILTISGAVTNTGTLETDKGSLTAQAAVTGSGKAVIDGGSLDFASSFTQNVSFIQTGVLELAQSQSFTGTISGFSKTGGTSLDLRDVGFVSPSEATFSGNSKSGVLTVSDATTGATALIHLKGDYLGVSFVASDDNHGGVIVTASAAPGPASSGLELGASHLFIAAMAGLGAGGGGPMIQIAEPWRPAQIALTGPGVHIA